MSEVRKATSEVKCVEGRCQAVTASETGRLFRQPSKKGQCNQPERDSDIGVKCDMCVSGSLRSDLSRLELRCEQ